MALDLQQKLGGKGGPSSLVARADASSVVAVAVLVEENQVAPVGIALEFLGAAVHGSAPTLIAEEDRREALRQLPGDLPERQRVSRSGREFYLEVVAVVVVVLLE